MAQAAVYIMMGVSGCGKTTVGEALAAELGCPYFDGDDFHPAENVAKMAGGTPLNDDDRRPWLARLHDLIHEHLARGESAVLSCSALKGIYRDQLREGNEGVQLVYLKGDFDTIWSRMKQRQGHYMKAEMLHSQFATLEEPGADEALALDITEPVDQLVARILRAAGR